MTNKKRPTLADLRAKEKTTYISSIELLDDVRCFMCGRAGTKKTQRKFMTVKVEKSNIQNILCVPCFKTKNIKFMNPKKKNKDKLREEMNAIQYPTTDYKPLLLYTTGTLGCIILARLTGAGEWLTYFLYGVLTYECVLILTILYKDIKMERAIEAIKKDLENKV